MSMLGHNCDWEYKYGRKGEVCSYMRTIQNDSVPAEGKCRTYVTI